ncbi:hypothetical protein CSHISOI_04826 [Colletotrichum shisoi]|uniref:Uncharacterized protein n=1 Tax=Colletotrichum shisoi TaxID=2078593 RepID=A0A5Q4BUC3_9PEZI|nr:hypothetical protein CSHISOI_04826 [Colletotrichum shisoi]
MSSTASLYVQYKKAEEQAFCKLFANQPYSGWKGWKLRQWHDHLPLYLNPQTAAEVIKNIETSIELRNGIAETYAAALKTPKDSRHEYFVRFLNSLVCAVRLLPAGPTKTGHDYHRDHKAQTIDTDEESLGDESLDEAGPTNFGHEEPCEPQAQTVDTGDESLGDESLDDLDRIMFQNAVQTFSLEASENWRKAVSNMQATELKAFLAQAELLHPSWFEPQDWVSRHMEDEALHFEQLIL